MVKHRCFGRVVFHSTWSPTILLRVVEGASWCDGFLLIDRIGSSNRDGNRCQPDGWDSTEKSYVHHVQRTDIS